MLEVACCPQSSGATRKYAGTSHIDVANLSEVEAGEIKAQVAEKGLTISGLGFCPNPLHPDPDTVCKTQGADLWGDLSLRSKGTLLDGGACENLALEPFDDRCHTYLVSDAGATTRWTMADGSGGSGPGSSSAP